MTSSEESVVECRARPWLLSCLPGKLQLEERHWVWGQNRLTWIWGLRGPEPALLSSPVGSHPWQRHAGWGWDRGKSGEESMSLPLLKGLEQAGAFLKIGNFKAFTTEPPLRAVTFSGLGPAAAPPQGDSAGAVNV